MLKQLKTNAEFCGSLPLHLINQIQDYGVLLVADTSGTIIQASQNIETLFGTEVSEVVDTPVAGWLAAASLQRLEEAIREGQSGALLTISLLKGGEFPATLHIKEGYHVLEIELQGSSDRSFIEHYEDLKGSMSAVQAAGTIAELGEAVVHTLKQRSGFDRIMIYQFDADWCGTVIAEAMEADLDPYLGLRFPPSDIPKQARDLYLRNAYRLIPNREFRPVKLYPVVNPVTNTFTDLADCNLRSVAGVHLEYLKNMKVMSSMSTRILRNGALWGLISCHHRSAKMPGREQCAMFELLSEVFSARLTALGIEADTAQQAALETGLASFVERLYQTRSLPSAFLHAEVAAQLQAGGMAYVTPTGTKTIGQVPDESQLMPLVYWLQSRHAGSLFATRNLADTYEESAAFRAGGSGLLSIPLRPEQGEYLLAFRPEQPEEVAWGGNPAEALQMDADGKGYHPRASFRQWQQTSYGQSRAWTDRELTFARELKHAVSDFLLQS